MTMRAVRAGSASGVCALRRSRMHAFEWTRTLAVAARSVSFAAAPPLTNFVLASTLIVNGWVAFRYGRPWRFAFVAFIVNDVPSAAAATNEPFRLTATFALHGFCLPWP